MQIEVENLSITFTQDQSEMTALKDVSLGIEKGEFICLLGPSGCGKSTLLNTMAGFLKPTEGTVKIDGKEVEHPSISYVTIFQNYGLLPWRNVEKNVALGLETEILFMDEPFGALDAITRMKLQDDILNICHSTQKTIVFVTHDIEEAIFLADRVVIMDTNPGQIKAVVKISLGKDRDRTSEDFLRIRDKIFELFHMKKEGTIEYYI